jgi:hypothetical protein
MNLRTLCIMAVSFLVGTACAQEQESEVAQRARGNSVYTYDCAWNRDDSYSLSFEFANQQTKPSTLRVLEKSDDGERFLTLSRSQSPTTSDLYNYESLNL